MDGFFENIVISQGNLPASISRDDCYLQLLFFGRSAFSYAHFLVSARPFF
ncbi:hypothetical protein CAter10_4950 [Collimonas arenae]|nr:hypothetical protein CAter10_4950 [Collimonas arenae]